MTPYDHVLWRQIVLVGYLCLFGGIALIACALYFGLLAIAEAGV